MAVLEGVVGSWLRQKKVFGGDGVEKGQGFGWEWQLQKDF